MKSGAQTEGDKLLKLAEQQRDEARRERDEMRRKRDYFADKWMEIRQARLLGRFILLWRVSREEGPA